MNKSTLLAALLLVGAIAFNTFTLWPEVAVETPTLNDNTLHLALVRRTVEALEYGEDPTDPWVSYFCQGYPLFHHYQHLSHITTALLHRALDGFLSLERLFHLLQYLLLCTFPLSIYWSGRRLGFSALPAALAALPASLLSTDGLYGLDMASYVWRGFGMYSQLWGMWLLGPALAGLYVTLREKRAYAGTVALLTATLLSHTVYGYIALLSGGLLVLLGGTGELGRRAGRLLLVLLLVAIVASYFLLPFAQDRLYMNRSVWEDPGKYDAYGWEWTLKALIQGDLLDYGRFPSLTVLAGLGLILCLVRRRQQEHYRLLPAFFGFWLLLYFGRPTWGVLLNLLPMGQDLHLHRFIGPVHLGAIGLIGVGLAGLGEWALGRWRDRRQLWWMVGTGLLGITLLAPVYAERIDYLATNSQWMHQDASAFAAENGDLDLLLSELEALPPARIYAGRGGNWGKEYRVGSVPLYALLATKQLDSPGYLYHALSLNADIEVYIDEARPATFNLFNLRYVVTPEGQPAPAFARPLAAFGRHRLYTVATSGYFDLVDSDLLLYGPREDWFEAARTWIQSSLVEGKQHPRISLGEQPATEIPALPLRDAPTSLSNLPWPLYESPCGQILGEQVTGNSYSVEFEAGRACWLLFKMTFHPGWQATLDGQAVSTHMLAPSFVGLAVTPGHHRVELRYEPGALRAWLRIVGLGTLLLVAAAEWQRKRWTTWVDRALAPLARLKSRPSWTHSSPHIPYLGALLLITLLVGLPLFQFKIMSGHDALAYLPRTVEFYQGLEEGQIFPRWAPDLSAGYGEPTFNFNAPLIYYASSLFHALGFSLIAAQNLAMLALLYLAGLGMYLLAGKAFGPRGGLVSAAAYVLAPYLLVTLYVRYALADFSAFAFMPLAFWGLYCFATSSHYRYLLIGTPSLALLILSSNSVSLITLPFLVLFLAWLACARWPKSHSDSVAVLLRGTVSLLLGLGLSAFFWLPALAEKEFVHVHRRLGGYLDFHNHFVYLHQLFFSPWGYGLSLAGAKDEMSFAIGPIHLVLLVAALLLFRRIRRASDRGDIPVAFFLILLLLAAFFTSHESLLFWEQLALLQPLQFPWRFLSLIAVGTAFICGFPFLLLSPLDKKLANGLMVAMILGLFLAGFAHARPEGFLEVKESDYSPESIAARGIQATAGQFEPIWVQTWPPTPAPPGRLILLSEQGQIRILESRLSGTHYTWLLQATDPVQLRVATFYFPGWQLRVDGQARPLSVQNPYGLMDFGLDAGTHQVELAFGPTPLRRWAGWISSGALVLLILAAIHYRRQRSWT